MADRALEGPGGARRLAARWIITADLVAQTALHLGSGEAGDFVDMALVRDPVGGGPLLTGETLAGALREYLCGAILGDGGTEEEGTTQAGFPDPFFHTLFGGRRGDPKGPQSALIAHNAKGGPATPEVRDGVSITPATGVALDHAKYDSEVWPPGTRFPITLEVLVPEGNAGSEAALLARLALATEGFAAREIRLGARGRRGLGRCHLENARAERFALGADAAGWLRWLRAGGQGGAYVPAGLPQGTVAEALCAAWPSGAAKLNDELDALRKQREAGCARLVLEVPIRFHGGALMGSPQESAAGADVRHLQSGGSPILAGTGVAGALRQRARRVARAVRDGRGDARAWLEALLGSEPPSGGAARRPGAGRSLTASPLTVEEVPLRGGHPLQVTRIHLDRFTQAPVAGALVQEEPVYGAQAALEFRLRLPRAAKEADALCGLLLLTLKDLLLGDVPLGGTTGVGRGALRPAGLLTVTVRGSRFTAPVDSGPTPAVRELIEGWVRAFHDHPALAPGGPGEAGPVETQEGSSA